MDDIEFTSSGLPVVSVETVESYLKAVSDDDGEEYIETEDNIYERDQIFMKKFLRRIAMDGIKRLGDINCRRRFYNELVKVSNLGFRQCYHLLSEESKDKKEKNGKTLPVFSQTTLDRLVDEHRVFPRLEEIRSYEREQPHLWGYLRNEFSIITNKLALDMCEERIRTKKLWTLFDNGSAECYSLLRNQAEANEIFLRICR